ncbi:response regulator [Thioclava sp. GXIMD4216]|uniref:Response regulator n=1 Tax=Thioclava litoralis TaxID=3076557 RepID=A0ABZ1DYH4_9RHOB|nr:response regulator [Thioclava sp. FTW29]
MARILIADDDENYLIAFSEGMEALGHETVCVTQSDRLLPNLELGGFDIVFLDVVMAGGGAIVALHKVREFSASLPVVVISGMPEVVDSPIFTLGMRAANARVSKSTSLAKLSELVDDLVSKARQ